MALNTTDPAHDFLALHYSPVPYVLSFALGVTAYRLREWYGEQLSVLGESAIAVALALVAVFVIKPGLITYFFHDEMIFVSAITFILLATLSPDGNFCRRLFLGQSVQVIGVLSFGMYLAHWPVILLSPKLGIPYADFWPPVKFAYLVVVSGALSAITLLALELPCQRFGRQLWSYWAARARTLAR